VILLRHFIILKNKLFTQNLNNQGIRLLKNLKFNCLLDSNLLAEVIVITSSIIPVMKRNQSENNYSFPFSWTLPPFAELRFDEDEFVY